MTSSSNKNIKSPLQMVGFYLAWVETALGGSLWAVANVDHWSRTLLICAIAFIGVIFAAVIAFILVFLALRRPHLLFNPSDYAASVQPLLFNSQDEIQVTNPPSKITPP
jgi:ABC-type phosphate/phosphonate transport system permease subunit